MLTINYVYIFCVCVVCILKLGQALLKMSNKTNVAKLLGRYPCYFSEYNQLISH